MRSNLLSITPVRNCEGVGQAEVKNSNRFAHDIINAYEVHRQEISGVKKVHGAHYHGQVCRLVAIQLLNSELPALGKQVEHRDKVKRWVQRRVDDNERGRLEKLGVILAHVHSDQLYFVITLKQNEQLIS